MERVPGFRAPGGNRLCSPAFQWAGKSKSALSRPIMLFSKAHTGDNVPLAAGQGKMDWVAMARTRGEELPGAESWWPCSCSIYPTSSEPFQRYIRNSPRRLLGVGEMGHPLGVFLYILCCPLRCTWLFLLCQHGRSLHGEGGLMHHACSLIPFLLQPVVSQFLIHSTWKACDQGRLMPAHVPRPVSFPDTVCF